VDRASGIAVGAEGDVHVTGGSQGADGRSGWVTIKYDRNGNELWAERHGGQDFYSPPAAIVLAGAGNVFVAGDLVQLGSNDIVKYDPSGKVLWVKQQPVTIASIAVAPEGSVYSTGRMEYWGQDYVTVKYQPPPLRRGYIDEDDEASITDAIAVLTYLFLGEDDLECLDAADIDDSGDINISDPIRLLRHLFVGGPAPAEPFSECGRDITADSIECTASEICSPFRDLPSMDFYGQDFQADGVLYVVDRSSNMMDAGELAIAKREILRTIGGFPETVEFGIIFFDSGVAQFPPGGAPVRADAEAKLAATSFVQSIDWGQGSCCHVGLLAGLECANQSEAQRKVLIYVGNGGGTCTGSDEPEYLEETLAAVTSLNTHGVEIHCIGIVSPSTQGRHFMHRLAWDNGGSYTEIVR
jgi:hypothetical protein